MMGTAHTLVIVWDKELGGKNSSWLVFFGSLLGKSILVSPELQDLEGSMKRLC